MRRILANLTLWYLRFFAKLQLLKFRPIVIGIGGASGKTSVANFIVKIVSGKFKVRETKGKNSETGIPLSILRLNVPNYTVFEWVKAVILAPIRVILEWGKFDVLVAEMGIDGPFEPKNMSYLLKIVKPRIGVLTNISYEHSVYFEEVSKDKQKILSLTKNQEQLLLKSLPRDGTAILNIDDYNISQTKGIKAQKITISQKEDRADFYIKKIGSTINSFNVVFSANSKDYQLKLNKLLPSHYAYSLVLAIATASALNINIEDSVKALRKDFDVPPGRMSVFNGIKDTVIIDSSYNNATLKPIIDLLDLLKNVAAERRKVVVFGDMRELGVISKTYHQQVAKKLLQTSDLVFLIGPLSYQFMAPILRANKHNFYSFNTFSDARGAIKNNIRKGDIVLVKSSQNTLFLERVVELLLKDKSDIKNLARRGKFWDKIRAKTP